MPDIHRLDTGLDRGEAFEFLADGVSVRAFAGETIAAALLAHCRRTLRLTAKAGAPRGYYCGMGVCWDCAMWVEGKGTVQACRTPATPGMKVSTLQGAKA